MPQFHLLLYLREIEFMINVSKGDYDNTYFHFSEILKNLKNR